MELSAIIFYLFSIVTVCSAAVMVLSKNIVHSAFALMFTLIGVALLYVLLNAGFVAAAQLLVYVGGILVLILFGVMLTSQELSAGFKTTTVQIIPASILSVITVVILIVVILTAEWNIMDIPEREDTVRDLGMLLLYDYILPFQVAGVLLLVAIIGAIYMATRVNQKTDS